MSFISGFPSGGTGGGSGTGEEAVEFGKVEEVWRHTETYSDPWTSVAVDSSENIYVARDGNEITKLTPKGDVLWFRKPSGKYYVNITVDTAGYIYTVGRGYLDKINSDGVQVMRFTVATAQSAVVDAQGFIYCVSRSIVVKLAADGATVWVSSKRYDTGGDLDVDVAGNVYAGDFTADRTYFLGKISSSGADVWRVALSDKEFASGGCMPVKLNSQGDVYLFMARWLHKIKATGEMIWRVEVDDTVYKAHTLAVDASDNVYVAHGKSVRKYSSRGIQVWKFPLLSDTSTSSEGSGVALGSSGNIYVAGYRTALRKLSNPAAGKLYTDSNAYDINWIQKTDVPNQYLISYR